MKRFLLMMLLLAAVVPAMGQNACPGLHNPTSFNSMSTDIGSWTARVGNRVRGTGGSTGSNVL
ncbi:MAG: hypothetical protein SPM02_04235, partial [Bacteroidales bacterium]|nr:hypothetical protein [Bacteroidales bacterium]